MVFLFAGLPFSEVQKNLTRYGRVNIALRDAGIAYAIDRRIFSNSVDGIHIAMNSALCRSHPYRRRCNPHTLRKLRQELTVALTCIFAGCFRVVVI